MPENNGSDAIVLWPRWRRKEDLRARVEKRIRSMVYEEGGLEEVMRVYDCLEGKEPLKGGVLQSIGYR
jgi:tRNA A37 N6-isopentenylltransferase MiaA